MHKSILNKAYTVVKHNLLGFLYAKINQEHIICNFKTFITLTIKLYTTECA